MKRILALATMAALLAGCKKEEAAAAEGAEAAAAPAKAEE